MESSRNTINDLLEIKMSAEKQIAEINKLLNTMIQTLTVTFRDNISGHISVKTKDAWPTKFNIDKKWTKEVSDILSIIFENPHTWSDVYEYMYSDKKAANMSTDRMILSLIKDFHDLCTDDFERSRLRDLAGIVYRKNKALCVLYNASDNIADNVNDDLNSLTIEDLEALEKYVSSNSSKTVQEIVQAINVIIFMMKHKQDHTWLFGKLRAQIREFINCDHNKILISIE